MKKNLKMALRYNDTEPLELALSLWLCLVNPFSLSEGHHFANSHDGIFMVCSIVSVLVGVSFLFGVCSGSLIIRKRVALLYWIGSIYICFVILRHGDDVTNSMFTSFGCQFVSSLFIYWRLSLESVHHKLKRKCQ